MEKQRAAKRARKQSYDPVASRRWGAAQRLARYGLTQEMFDQMLVRQGNACGMCREPFKDGRRICIDHDHTCCPQEKRSCGKCVRGLLCVPCNITLGFLESEQKQDQARRYLSECQKYLKTERTESQHGAPGLIA